MPLSDEPHCECRCHSDPNPFVQASYEDDPCGLCGHGGPATEPPFNCDIFRCDQLAEWAIIGESGDVYLCAEHYETQTSPRSRPRWQRISHAE